MVRPAAEAGNEESNIQRLPRPLTYFYRSTDRFNTRIATVAVTAHAMVGGNNETRRTMPQIKLKTNRKKAMPLSQSC
jgi:hypothetical protein